MARNIVARISPAALRHNFSRVRHYAPASKIMAMVKANAYGHGLPTVARIFDMADALGVASIEEALLIRRTGVQTEIVLMEGIFRSEELPLVQTHRLTQVIHHWSAIQALKEYSGECLQPFRVWIKVNTGMNRLGFPSHEFNEAYQTLQALSGVDIVGFMTHFSCADDKTEETARQIQQFNAIIGERAGARCLSNSAGILAWPQGHGDWVRPGLMLYGASPFQDKMGADFDLKPAMTFCSELIAIQTLALGDRVGYGATWSNAKETATIGIIAMGYGDGYPWHARSGTPVLVNGHRVSTVGRVSMDMLAVDLSSIEDAKIGDPVVLWGEGLPIEEVAQHAGTIPYELFCRFTERVTVKVCEER